MKKLVCLAVAVAGIMTASAGFAAQGPALYAQTPITPINPVPDVISQQPEAATVAPEVGATPIPVQGTAIPLFSCVKYKDQCKAAPCAVPMIVMVKDPCPVPCDPCNRCATPAPKCVAVQICVPPCSTCPPKVTCKRCGEYVRYDFGKYAVEIRSKKGVVTVDYDA
jgi:hypothetical protein